MAENKRPDDAMPPAAPVRPMNPEELRQAEVMQQNAINAEVAERDVLNGPDGGRYKVGDRMVDANGEPVKDKQDE